VISVVLQMHKSALMGGLHVRAMSEQTARANHFGSQESARQSWFCTKPRCRPKFSWSKDEMMLRMRAVDIVEDAGFTPIEAVNADEALAILESRADIALLFTDIQMPGSMDGLKLAHAVHERWPSIKIILVSGQLTPTEADKPTNSRFFGKPLEVKQMIAEDAGNDCAGLADNCTERRFQLLKQKAKLSVSRCQKFLGGELVNREVSGRPRVRSARLCEKREMSFGTIVSEPAAIISASPQSLCFTSSGFPKKRLLVGLSASVRVN